MASDETRVLYSSQYFGLALDGEGVEFVQSGDEVLIVALTDAGEVILTREPSPAFGGETLILPGGSTEAGEAHEVTANRELQEEVGLRAGRVDFLGELRRWSKYLRVRSFVYLARGLTPASLQGDEPYEIGLVRVPLQDVEGQCSGDILCDAGAIAAVLLARKFLAAEAAPD